MPEETNISPSDPISLSSITYTAQVDSIWASVTARQEYHNTAAHAVEAVYCFPLPPEAAVTSCKMRIGSRVIQAELKERAKARREYDDAVAAGHDATLLEQERPNIFTMNVGRVDPGETVMVELGFITRVGWQDSGGRFQLPLVVAPRFISGTPNNEGGTDTTPDADRITPPVQTHVPYTVNINLDLRAGFPASITSPSHALQIPATEIQPHEGFVIELKNLTPDRDFVLCYRTTSYMPTVTARRGEYGTRQYGIVTLAPPVLPHANRPRDVEMVLDISGSMRGPKLEGLKQVAKKVLRRLEEENLGNRVGIIAFESTYTVLCPLGPITAETYAAIEKLETAGSTEAGPAIDYGFEVLDHADSSHDKYMLLVTDGDTSSTPKSIKPIPVIGCVIDTAGNLEYLQELAERTNGTYLSVLPGEDLDVAANLLTGMLSGPALRKISVLDNRGNAMTEVVGLTDVYFGRPVTFCFSDNLMPETLQLRATDSNGHPWSYDIKLTSAETLSFAHQVWAREKLRTKLSAADQLQISLEHGLLSAQTAFVAVAVRSVPGEKPVREEIPVALPHTWDFGNGVMGVMRRMTNAGGMYRGGGMLEAASFMSMAGDDDLLVGSSGSEELFCMDEVVSEESILEDEHPAQKLVTLALHLELGAVSVEEAQRQWNSIEAECTQAAIATWSEEERAQAFLALLKLKVRGIQVDTVLLTQLSARPQASNAVAMRAWSEAQRFAGNAISAQP